jgi:heptosyltransferase II
MEKMKILVRLPNWLGDMVMSVGAVQQLYYLFPWAEISVIVKKGLHELLPHFPPFQHIFIFNKEDYSGLKGVWRFGKKTKNWDRFDLFISFPDSFSAAMMGYATGAKVRIGFKKEGREVLLTHAYTKPNGLHRVEEYTTLLALYTGLKDQPVSVKLKHHFPKEEHLVININSEAQSRRLTTEKAVEVISEMRKNFSNKIVLIGGGKEKDFVEKVVNKLPLKEGIVSVAGKTSLPQLVEVLASAKAVLTTDSGPAHLANALGTQTVVLFGAGNENNTSPYNEKAVQVLRLGKLSCEPCVKNVCVQFGTPQCLELMETPRIIEAVHQRIQHAT